MHADKPQADHRDARGCIHQIQLGEISGITTPGRIISPKLVRLNLRGAAYDIYCLSKDQRKAIEYWLAQAIRQSYR